MSIPDFALLVGVMIPTICAVMAAAATILPL